MIKGVSYFAQGARMTLRKDVRPFVFLPAAVSLAIIVGGLTLGFSYINDLSNYLIASLPEWLSFLQWIFQPLLYLLGLLVGAWSFGFIATIIGSPFLGDLALKVDNMPDPQIVWYKQILPALSRELRKLRYHIPRLILLLLLGVIPIVNTLAPFLWVAFGAWLMAVQFCDYTTENRQKPFEDTLAALKGHRTEALGFGACVTLAMAIPLANFLVAPIAVVGGTLLMKSIRERSSNV